jgi:hypothetical protein
LRWRIGGPVTPVQQGGAEMLVNSTALWKLPVVHAGQARSNFKSLFQKPPSQLP